MWIEPGTWVRLFDPSGQVIGNTKLKEPVDIDESGTVEIVIDGKHYVTHISNVIFIKDTRSIKDRPRYY